MPVADRKLSPFSFVMYLTRETDHLYLFSLLKTIGIPNPPTVLTERVMPIKGYKPFRAQIFANDLPGPTV